MSYRSPLNLKQVALHGGDRPSTRLAAFRQLHQQTRFVDVLLADLCGIPRGKRVAIAELPITWPAAALKLAASSVMREYLGEKFHRLFVTTGRGGNDLSAPFWEP